ncbi:MAG TPA: carbon storage regulator, partial [Polyangiaceae bacterium]
MLIGTRRKVHRIVLGHDIEIVITDISRSGVKIGIVAPNSMTILRGEVRDAVEQANRESLESSFAEPVSPALPAVELPIAAASIEPAANAASNVVPPALSDR